MKRKILFISMLFCLFKVYGQSSGHIGEFRDYFTFSHTEDTRWGSDSYRGQYANDVTYRFTLLRPMYVYFSHDGSVISPTWIHITDERGNELASTTDGYYSTNMDKGTYYVISEGDQNINGYITTSIEGIPDDSHGGPFDAGIYTDDFIYRDIRNTEYCPGYTFGEFFHNFTITKAMKVIISHCDSEPEHTEIALYDESMKLIAHTRDNTGAQGCSNGLHGYLEIAELNAGTYNVRSVGGAIEGNIKLIIEGKLLDQEPEESGPDNYVLTIKPTVATDDASSLTVDNSISTYQYFDGLGRPYQTVEVGGNPNKADIVTYQEYDVYGRETNAWLPVTATKNNGLPLLLSKVTSLSSTLYGDTKAYSKSVYEASPLNRKIDQYGAGKDWHDNTRRVKTEYLTNNSSYVCKWYRTTDIRDSIQISITSGKLNYPASQLFVTRITDEDNNISYEFKDKLGKLILSRQMNGTIAHDTYHIYDSYGNLRAVLPPLAADALTAVGTNWTWKADGTDILSKYAYLYKYDNRNRCIAKKLPGADWIYYVYDTADRLIFTQDGENRKQRKWLFTIPDEMGRTVLTGTCTNSMTFTADPLGSNTAKASRNNTTGTYKGYLISGVSLSGAVILSANYYDDYNFMGKNGIPSATDSNFKYETVSGYGTRYTTSSKGLLTGTLNAQINHSGTVTSFLYSVMYYDNRGRMIQMKSNNQLAGVDKEYIGYNFSGLPIKRKLVHQAKNKTTQTQLYEYLYNHVGQLLQTKHGLNTTTASTVIALNTYDDLGRLKTQKKGSLPATTYTYNVRSWTKSITNSSLFTQTLYYNDSYASNDKTYNGNISAMSWKVGTETLRGYRFDYDDFSQVTKAEYLVNGALNNNYKVPSISYDKHGNITALERWGKTASGYGQVDKLSTAYNGNQLTKVSDAAVKLPAVTSGLNDFRDVDNTTDYTYNKNGAMAKDLNKGISSITYNCLNLPGQLTINSVTNKYTYSADGRKLKVHYGTGNDSINYVGNIIYEKGSLKQILIDGGYIDNKVYHYYINDHQGNNRVVATGSGTIVQKNHYYPFGMTFGEVSNTEQDKQRFKYNGKELDRKNGLNLYDYSARYMEPALGRFTTMDPLAEKYYNISPYAYCANNPMRFVDPTGMNWYSYMNSDNKTAYGWNPDIKSQKDLDKTMEGAKFIGKTYYNNNKYYSLFGKTLEAESFEGKIIQKMDMALINYHVPKEKQPSWGGEDIKTEKETNFDIGEYITDSNSHQYKTVDFEGGYILYYKLEKGQKNTAKFGGMGYLNNMEMRSFSSWGSTNLPDGIPITFERTKTSGPYITTAAAVVFTNRNTAQDFFQTYLKIFNIK